MKMKAIAAVLAVLTAVLALGGCGNSKSTESAASSAVSQTASKASSQAETSDSASDSMDSLMSELSGVSVPTTTQTTESAAAETQPGTASGGTSSGELNLSVKIDSTDGTEEFYIPDTWADLKGSMDSTGETEQSYTVEAGSLDEQMFLISNGESRHNSSLLSLEDYSKTLVDGVSKSTDFSNVQNAGTADLILKNSGLTAKKTVLTVNYQNQSVSYYIYAIEGSERYYQVCCWTIAANQTAAGQTFDAIVNTFTEI